MKNLALIGDVIRYERQTAGLTQEALCEGICDPTTISRIESGRQTPSRERAVALLARLNRSPHRAYFLFPVDREETEAGRLLTEANNANNRFCTVKGEERELARKRFFSILRELEPIMKKWDAASRRYWDAYLYAMGVMPCGPEGEYPPERQIEVLVEVLRTHLPKFDLDHISRCCYCLSEMQIILKIAVLYRDLGDRERFSSIIRQLSRHIREHCGSMERNARRNPSAVVLYAIVLSAEERWEEAIRIAELGRRASVTYRCPENLFFFLNRLAYCYAKSGDQARSRFFYRQSYCLCLALGWKDQARAVQPEAEF